ncbi:MAG: hypothetical protein FJX33_05365 [Alphaproteobacteria bacterium]|nr:hypothetical protein [Alphaproteobacteria bacterium]
MRGSAARIDCQGTTDKRRAFLWAAGHGGGDTGKMQGIKIARVALHDGAKAGLGISDMALLEKGNGFAELLANGARWKLHLITGLFLPCRAAAIRRLILIDSGRAGVNEAGLR